MGGTSLARTQDGLHGHPQETLDVALLVHDRDAVDQGDRIGQVGKVDVGTPDKPEPVGKIKMKFDASCAVEECRGHTRESGRRRGRFRCSFHGRDWEMKVIVPRHSDTFRASVPSVA